MTQTRTPNGVLTPLKSGVTHEPQYLTGLDLFQTHTGITFTLVYEQGLDSQAMQRSLQTTLAAYPSLTGRIKRDTQGYAYIDGNDQGMSFKVRTHPGAMPAYGIDRMVWTDLSLYRRRFFPWQVVNKDQALLNIEIHHFEQGGALLTFTAAHSVCDGASCWIFMMDWLRTHHGHTITPPALDRNALINFSQVHVAACHEAQAGLQILSKPKMLKGFARLAWQHLTALDWVSFRIPGEQLARWKQEALATWGEDQAPGTQDLVLAQCLKRMSPHMRSHAQRHLGFVTDLRFRRGVGVPRKYVGNALGRDMISLDAATIAANPAPALAAHLTTPLDHTPLPDMLGALGVMERHRQQRSIHTLSSVAGWHTVDAGLIINNSAHIPVYKMDFGSGPPSWHEYERSPYRRVLLTPSAVRDGGLDIHLSAPRHELAEFRQWQAHW